MEDRGKRWRRIHEDGAEWEARAVMEPRRETGPHRADTGEVLEFVCVDGSRGARRLAVPAGSLGSMDDEALYRAFRRARPIGGDYYGRPGKRMADGV